MNNFPLLCDNDIKTLNECLLFLKMHELRKVCVMLSLPESGKKQELITRITFYMQTGIIRKLAQVPSASLAKNYPKQDLTPNALMLYGGYKNDLMNRNFFKNLIGPHFHYTAYGIDWLNDRWLEGNPPTYKEFADFWLKKHKNGWKKKQHLKKNGLT